MKDKTFKTKEGHLALLKCGSCNRENYASSIYVGVCAWCGRDVNEDLKEGE